MRRSFAFLAGAVMVLALSASALAAATKVQVSPGKGGIHTEFVVRFSIPEATGTQGTVDVSDSLAIAGHGHAGCVGATNVPLHAAPAGTSFKITLNPSHLNGHWCTGKFTGSLLQTQSTVCRPAPIRTEIVCPDYVLAPRVLGRFTFDVMAPKKGGSHR